MYTMEELNDLMIRYEKLKRKESESLELISALNQELLSEFYKKFPPLKKVDRLIFQVSTVSKWLELKRSRARNL